MLVGEPVHVTGVPFVVSCPTAGCGNKLMQVEVSLGPVKRTITFMGTTAPRFEEPPVTTDEGRDLPASTILRLRWERLTFDAIDPFFGPIRLELQTRQSRGRVYSLANQGRREFGAWLDPGSADGTNFFPAVNENRLHFLLRLPRFGLTFRNKEPIVNGATIEAIPPIGTEYRLREPVEFRARRLPLSLRLDHCRMAMSVLTGVKVEVTDFVAVSPLVCRMVLGITNESSADDVKLGLSFHSAAGIVMRPGIKFLQAHRQPIHIEVELDATRASAPGFILVGIVLVEPYESPGAEQVLIDYDEIRLGRLDARAPDFSAGHYESSPMRFLD